MKLCIAGSRSITDELPVRRAVARAMKLFGFQVSAIEAVISGTAQGVDQVGERLAQRHGIPVERYPADWEQYGKRAGYLRNYQMAAAADLVVVVWDGVSRGSKHMIDICETSGVPCHVEVVPRPK